MPLFTSNLRKQLTLPLQILLILAVYFSIQAYHKRDIAYGVAPHVPGNLLDGTRAQDITVPGRPYIIHFWATWCRVCRLEQGAINSLSKDHPIVAIASESGESTDVRHYANEHKLRFPILVDTTGDIAGQFGVHAFPTTFIVDSKGQIRYVEVGYTTELGIRARLNLVD